MLALPPFSLAVKLPARTSGPPWDFQDSLFAFLGLKGSLESREGYLCRSLPELPNCRATFSWVVSSSTQTKTTTALSPSKTLQRR